MNSFTQEITDSTFGIDEVSFKFSTVECWIVLAKRMVC